MNKKYTSPTIERMGQLEKDRCKPITKEDLINRLTYVSSNLCGYWESKDDGSVAEAHSILDEVVVCIKKGILPD